MCVLWLWVDSYLSISFTLAIAACASFVLVFIGFYWVSQLPNLHWWPDARLHMAQEAEAAAAAAANIGAVNVKIPPFWPAELVRKSESLRRSLKLPEEQNPVLAGCRFATLSLLVGDVAALEKDRKSALKCVTLAPSWVIVVQLLIHPLKGRHLVFAPSLHRDPPTFVPDYYSAGAAEPVWLVRFWPDHFSRQNINTSNKKDFIEIKKM